MSELLAFVGLGFLHITDVTGVDHILFLFALAAAYRLDDWHDALWVVTAFTVGHSVTLALAATGTLHLPGRVVEFLIPVTIVATGVENVVGHEGGAAPWGRRYRPVFAGVFGLVHGAGFANYLRSLFVDRVAAPLFGFNVGIELGQLVVLALAGVALVAVDALLARVRLPAAAPAPLRLRVIAVSGVVALVATRWAVERSPW